MDKLISIKQEFDLEQDLVDNGGTTFTEEIVDQIKIEAVDYEEINSDSLPSFSKPDAHINSAVLTAVHCEFESEQTINIKQENDLIQEIIVNKNSTIVDCEVVNCNSLPSSSKPGVISAVNDNAHFEFESEQTINIKKENDLTQESAVNKNSTIVDCEVVNCDSLPSSSKPGVISAVNDNVHFEFESEQTINIKKENDLTQEIVVNKNSTIVDCEVVNCDSLPSSSKPGVISAVNDNVHFEFESEQTINIKQENDLIQGIFVNKNIKIEQIRDEIKSEPIESVEIIEDDGSPGLESDWFNVNPSKTEKDIKLYHCLVCSETLSEDFSNHVRQHLINNELICNICGEHCGSYYQLINHLENHSVNRLYNCIYCNKNFKAKGTLDSHLRIHLGEKKFVCEVCGWKFLRKQDLSNHRSTHSDRLEFQCHYCARKFKLKKYLYLHLRTHTGERPFKCNLCEKSFSHKQNLIDHENTHMGTHFECFLCSKILKTKIGLDFHLQNHNSSTKLFRCEYCGKEYSHRSTLSAHRRKHKTPTVEPPPEKKQKVYQCQFCDKIYRHASTLSSHRNTHNEILDLKMEQKIYQCEFCSKTYSNRFSLASHRKASHKYEVQQIKLEIEKAYKCDTCNLSFAYESTFLLHKRSHYESLIAEEDDNEMSLASCSEESFVFNVKSENEIKRECCSDPLST